MMRRLKYTYRDPRCRNSITQIAYIQENGQRTRRDGILNDTSRVEYMQTYIGAVLDAVRNGSNTKGYFEWTFLDCLELLVPFESSFGMFYVDLDDKELKRYQKLSALWYSNFLKEKSIGEYAITQVADNGSLSLT